MLCGGEAMPRALADRLLDKGDALWNVYGPTETTVWSSAWRVEPGDGPISIGRPIAETRLYVLDKRLRAVPVGVTGELYIGGAGLARGYRGRPGLTAERFVPDPFAGEPGARLYRTGDLARWRPDGTLECLGRVDHQVKIRGFRVELGEIEAALSAHPGVREAAVAARPDATGEMSLAAYFVPRGEAASPSGRRRAPAMAVRTGSPSTWCPSAFVVLDALPLTPNGKVDRKALPDPAHARARRRQRLRPPRGPIEEALAEAWAELLGGERIGAHDNFFERGGHSLMALQLLGRIRGLFDVEAPLKDFIEGPTLARTWPAWSSEPWPTATDRPGPAASKRVDRDGPLPASFAQQRLWFLDRLEPGSARLQRPHRRHARRPARRRRPPPRTRRGCPPPRGPADDVRRRRRRPAARSSPIRSSCPCPSRTCPDSPRPSGRAHPWSASARRRPRPFDLVRGPAHPRRPDPPGRAASTSSR